jgi:alkylation response protein AidB-like acyl-CoA dehydrogenase
MSEWVECARALKDDILAARERMDAERRCPDDLAQKLAAAGLFRLCVPEVYGGVEAHPRALAETIEALAETDASTAWCVMIGATTGALAGYLPPDAAREIFAPPDAIVTGVYAPMGKADVEGEHYRLAGRWKWNSAGQISHWLAVGCRIIENGAPKLDAGGAPMQRMMLVPRSAVSFIDTWRTSGLRGTGSGDMMIQEALAGQSHSVSLADDTPRVKRPLYAFPVFGLLALGIAAVASGNAKAALDEFAATASAKRAPGGRTLAERSATQVLFAHAYADYSAARAWLMSEIDAAWHAASTAADIAIERRASLRLAATHMTRTSADVVRRLQDFAGGGAVFEGDPLHRRLNDAQTATAHIMIGPATYELTGRALLGAPVSGREL